MSKPYDRPATEPGGMECMDCGVIFVGAEWHDRCAVCAAKPQNPDDIRKAAEAVIDRGYDEGMVEALERALMNERERCAKIAEEWEPIRRLLPLADDSHNEAAHTGQYEAGERIAAAIRRGDNPDA